MLPRNTRNTHMALTLLTAYPKLPPVTQSKNLSPLSLLFVSLVFLFFMFSTSVLVVYAYDFSSFFFSLSALIYFQSTASRHLAPAAVEPAEQFSDALLYLLVYFADSSLLLFLLFLSCSFSLSIDSLSFPPCFLPSLLSFFLSSFLPSFLPSIPCILLVCLLLLVCLFFSFIYLSVSTSCFQLSLYDYFLSRFLVYQGIYPSIIPVYVPICLCIHLYHCLSIYY